MHSNRTEVSIFGDRGRVGCSNGAAHNARTLALPRAASKPGPRLPPRSQSRCLTAMQLASDALVPPSRVARRTPTNARAPRAGSALRATPDRLAQVVAVAVGAAGPRARGGPVPPQRSWYRLATSSDPRATRPLRGPPSGDRARPREQLSPQSYQGGPPRLCRPSVLST